MRLLACNLLFALALAAPATAGPPWIAIEYPANPFHETTRGAVLLVRSYHHATEVEFPVQGTAEGVVNGKRVSRRLDLRRTAIPGTYALRGELPKDGRWLLVITATQGKDDNVTALVTVERGRIANVEVPASRNREGWMIPKQVTAADIDQRLKAPNGPANRP